eukprot:jgi/Bigna1/72466/fgenesh1_pg.20_\
MNEARVHERSPEKYPRNSQLEFRRDPPEKSPRNSQEEGTPPLLPTTCSHFVSTIKRIGSHPNAKVLPARNAPAHCERRVTIRVRRLLSRNARKARYNGVITNINGSRGFSSPSERDWEKAPPLWIRNGLVVNHDGMFQADVLTDKGVIKKVGSVLQDELPSNTREIDATGRYVIPGGIDTHTHMEVESPSSSLMYDYMSARELNLWRHQFHVADVLLFFIGHICKMPFMGTVSIDDFHYGTTAAVAGGTTCLLDFVIPGRGQSLVEAYKEWERKAVPKINCDIGFHMAVTWFGDQVLEEMGTLAKEYGVTSYKFFLAYNGVLRMYDDELLKVFRRCKELGVLAQVHAENGDMVDDGQESMISNGIYGPEGHPMSKPRGLHKHSGKKGATEAEATHRAIAMADQVNVPLFVVHVMSKSAPQEVERAKAKGINVYGEPLAVALACDGREYYHPDWRHAAGYVMSPPLREDPSTKLYLAEALKSGNGLSLIFKTA